MFIIEIITVTFVVTVTQIKFELFYIYKIYIYQKYLKSPNL